MPLHVIIGLSASVGLVAYGSMVCWRLGRISGLRSALSHAGGIAKRNVKPVSSAETARLLRNVANVIAVVVFPSLLSCLFVVLPKEYSVPAVIVCAIALAIVLVRSLVASHGADDDTRLKIQFVSFAAVVALLSPCLAVIVFSLLWSHVASFPIVSTIAAMFGVLPFGFVQYVDRIKDRVFPATKRILAMRMVSLHQKFVIVATLEMIILSDIPTVVALAGSGLMNEFYGWCQAFVFFIWAMVFHYVGSTYQYLLQGGIVKKDDTQHLLAEMMRKPLADC